MQEVRERPVCEVCTFTRTLIVPPSGSGQQSILPGDLSLPQNRNLRAVQTNLAETIALKLGTRTARRPASQTPAVFCVVTGGTGPRRGNMGCQALPVSSSGKFPRGV